MSIITLLPFELDIVQFEKSRNKASIIAVNPEHVLFAGARPFAKATLPLRRGLFGCIVAFTAKHGEATLETKNAILFSFQCFYLLAYSRKGKLSTSLLADTTVANVARGSVCSKTQIFALYRRNVYVNIKTGLCC